MRAFVAASNQHKEELSNVLDVITGELQAHGFETDLFVRKQKKNLSAIEIMNKAFKLIDKCDLLVVEMSTKEVGVGIEMGYAKSRNIPIIGVRRIGSEPSTTMEGTLSLPVKEYENASNLKNVFSSLIVRCKNQ